MSKIRKVEYARVIVNIDIESAFERSGVRRFEHVMRDAELMARKIRAVFHDEMYFDKASVDARESDYCSHCGSPWEEFDDGLPACCDKARAEWAKNAELEVKDANG